MKQFFVLLGEVWEESRGDSGSDGPVVLDVWLEACWEGVGGGDDEEEVPVDVLGE